MITENYLDPDVAYLLGLITIRGELYESQGDKRIIIQFPFKSLIAEGIKIHVDQKDQLDMAVNRIRDRLQELVESHFDVEHSGNQIVFSMRFLRNSMVWRNIRYMFGTKKSFREFEIPRSILEAPDEAIKIEFLRGVADAGGSSDRATTTRTAGTESTLKSITRTGNLRRSSADCCKWISTFPYS